MIITSYYATILCLANLGEFDLGNRLQETTSVTLVVGKTMFLEINVSPLVRHCLDILKMFSWIVLDYIDLVSLAACMNVHVCVCVCS